MIGSEFLQYIFSNISEDNIRNIRNMFILVAIVPMINLDKYLQDNFPMLGELQHNISKYRDKLYSKFFERCVIEYGRIYYEISERHNPINVALEYLARTGRRYIPRQFRFFETNFNKIDKIFNSIRRRIESEESRIRIDSEESRRRIESEEIRRRIELEESRRRIYSEERIRRIRRIEIEFEEIMRGIILLPDFVDEEIEIPEDAICGITYERPNCRTSCSHYFCNIDITRWLKQQQNEGRKMTCPSCRSIITKVSLAQEN